MDTEFWVTSLSNYLLSNVSELTLQRWLIRSNLFLKNFKFDHQLVPFTSIPNLITIKQILTKRWYRNSGLLIKFFKIFFLLASWACGGHWIERTKKSISGGSNYTSGKLSNTDKSEFSLKFPSWLWLFQLNPQHLVSCHTLFESRWLYKCTPQTSPFSHIEYHQDIIALVFPSAPHIRQMAVPSASDVTGGGYGWIWQGIVPILWEGIVPHRKVDTTLASILLALSL